MVRHAYEQLRATPKTVRDQLAWNASFAAFSLYARNLYSFLTNKVASGNFEACLGVELRWISAVGVPGRLVRLSEPVDKVLQVGVDPIVDLGRLFEADVPVVVATLLARVEDLLVEVGHDVLQRLSVGRRPVIVRRWAGRST
jgi:hypothetical protein